MGVAPKLAVVVVNRARTVDSQPAEVIELGQSCAKIQGWTTRQRGESREQAGRPEYFATIRKARPPRMHASGCGFPLPNASAPPGRSAWRCTPLPTPTLLPFSQDFRDLLSALSAAEARFLIVGGYAVAFHGRPRATKDLDVWVDATSENAVRVLKALTHFGAPLHGLLESELATPGIALQIGVPPQRIDVLTNPTGIRFAEAWTRRVEVAITPDLLCPVIGREDLLANKRAAARPQDLADVAALERANSE